MLDVIWTSFVFILITLYIKDNNLQTQTGILHILEMDWDEQSP